MRVCLTGDVHHESLGTNDQSVLDTSEPETAVEYAEIVDSYDLSATLFVTGRTVEEERAVIERLAEYDCIEIGGHNYGAFTVPRVPYSSKLFSLHRAVRGTNCPRFLQRRSIEKTIDFLEDATGQPVVTWRDHGFNCDGHTYELLADAGIRGVSDARDPDATGPYATENGRLTEVPINVPPDHDHIEHGLVDYPDAWSDPFSGEQYSGVEWLSRVLRGIDRLSSYDDAVVTILAHPACMALVECFDIFDRLCARLADYETVTMRELLG